MSLEHAILGILQYKPISGYDIKKIFDTSISHFWSADQSQIYRTLNKLANEEKIEMELIIQDSKPNSKIYHITDKGKDEFINWLNSSINMVELRIPWLMQIFFAAKLSDENIIKILKQVKQQIQIRIDSNIKNREDIKLAEDMVTQRDLFFMELTYDYGRMHYESIIRWIERVINQLEKKEHPQK